MLVISSSGLRGFRARALPDPSDPPAPPFPPLPSSPERRRRRRRRGAPPPSSPSSESSWPWGPSCPPSRRSRRSHPLRWRCRRACGGAVHRGVAGGARHLRRRWTRPRCRQGSRPGRRSPAPRRRVRDRPWPAGRPASGPCPARPPRHRTSCRASARRTSGRRTSGRTSWRPSSCRHPASSGPDRIPHRHHRSARGTACRSRARRRWPRLRRRPEQPRPSWWCACAAVPSSSPGAGTAPSAPRGPGSRCPGRARRRRWCRPSRGPSRGPPLNRLGGSPLAGRSLLLRLLRRRLVGAGVGTSGVGASRRVDGDIDRRLGCLGGLLGRCLLGGGLGGPLRRRLPGGLLHRSRLGVTLGRVGRAAGPRVVLCAALRVFGAAGGFVVVEQGELLVHPIRLSPGRWCWSRRTAHRERATYDKSLRSATTLSAVASHGRPTHTNRGRRAVSRQWSCHLH